MNGSLQAPTGDDGLQVVKEQDRPGAGPSPRNAPTAAGRASPTPPVCQSSYLAAMVAIGPLAPIVAALASVLVYAQHQWLAIPLQATPVLAGTATALLLGLLAALVFRPFTSADHANAGSFGELLSRVEQLGARLAGTRHTTAERHSTPSIDSARAEAVTHYEAIRRELTRGGPQWILGSGYVNLWTRMHRAEEAMIVAEPSAEDVVGGALYDELRIQGSHMDNEGRLLGLVRQAVHVLSSSAGIYFSEPPAVRPVDANPIASMGAPLLAARDAAFGDAAPLGIVVSAVDQPPTSGGADDQPTSAEKHTGATRPGREAAEARVVLRYVRSALNSFRDERWNRLVRARNRILGTMTLTGLVTYALLVFVLNVRESGVQQDAMRDPIIAAMGFYLVGAIVGLFDRLNSESKDSTAEEDFGLANARLLLTPVLSGLAAVGGVLITAMLVGSVNVDVLVPRDTPGSMVSPPVPVTPTPAQIFSLAEYPFGLLLAALFGLTPKLLVDRLRQESQRYKADLRSTHAQQGALGRRRSDEQPARPPAAVM